MSEPEHFIHFFVSANSPLAQREVLRSWCILFLEKVVEARRKAVAIFSEAGTSSGSKKGKVQMVGLEDVDDGAEAADDGTGLGKMVWNTLLELYLESDVQRVVLPETVSKKPAIDLVPIRGKGKLSVLETLPPSLPALDGETRSKKIMDLLIDSKSAYDVDHALVLCKWHNFKAGSVFLNEKLGLYSSILQIHMDAEAYDEAIADCEKYGDKEPSLWSTALIYFAQRDPACRSQLHQVLNAIETRDLIPPLQVLQSLAREAPGVTIGTVKDYLMKQVAKERDEIDEADRLIEMYRAETETMRKQIDEIQNK
ncbi:Vacuolar protein sorting-associated protein 11 [Gonapodya sp. JEL0774]|nr:Vacuolar protein sorting-associated protein 11 [Gonapodya sp. JEL0774]